MAELRRLSELAVGEAGLVRRLEGDLGVKRRLLAMGFVPGTEVAVQGVAPMGDPVVFRVMGYRLSLRREEAGLVLVEPVERRSLALAGPGRYRVSRVTGGWGMRRRLARSGVRPGVLLEKLADEGCGPVRILAGGREVLLGRGMASKVMVEPEADG